MPNPASHAVGRRLVVRAERVAHGGHVVGRSDGQVVFVRHGLPGELLEVEVTSAGPKGRFLRADVVRVLEASDDRVEPPCAHAGSCGGCDWQHASLPAQRRLKAEVIAEQLERLGGVIEIDGVPLADAVTVSAVAGDVDGLGWRTRVRFAATDDGRLGLRRHRSHEVEVVDACPLASAGVDAVGATRRRWPGATEVEVVVGSGGDSAVVVEPSTAARSASSLPQDVAIVGVRGRTWVAERAAGRDWRVQAHGFWQVHPGAADALVATVRGLLSPRPGERVLDLFAGVGLFAGCLGEDVGVTGAVDAVESSVAACKDARRNLHDLPQVRIHNAPVQQWLATGAPERVDLVVLDPPRSGAGRAVIEAVLGLGARAVAYVACDPAALGRDVGIARALGWRPAAVRGLDLFPMTQHVETVALLVPPA
jgi:tRNA/tmRNA/rRNA uracil-C5-methylase (TrmA/RlmC/RlmD family)